MKALSLSQPWADVILEQGKRVENRVDRGPWRGGCSYRGPILLHASLGLGTREELGKRLGLLLAAGAPIEFITERFDFIRGPSGFTRSVPRPALRLGGVVGRAKIVDTIDPKQSVKGELFASSFEEEFQRVTRAHRLVDQRRFWFGGFALVLADVEPLPFRPCKGALGLFNLPDDFARAA